MLSGRTDRLWMIGGVLAAAILLTTGWFALLSPQHAKTALLREEAESVQVQSMTLRSRLSELRAQNAELPRYRTELAAVRKALPTTVRSEEFLKQLQQVGDAADVSVTGIGIGAAADVNTGKANAAGKADKKTPLKALPVSVTVNGPDVPELEDFLRRLLQVQPRAVLVDSVVLSVTSETSGGGTIGETGKAPGEAADEETDGTAAENAAAEDAEEKAGLMLNLKIFVAPETGE
ncbi:hypothetical protein [Planomonospora sp. ID82291]|uniref:hypothetical protein n=1 Tax=Planomonospora sp. ID82291 TaxID=2738136 RepID=UPI0018C3D686|nr:hypothetical protein [Planomonospora sp. ID82291]MBG0813118.1 hypothetical protein [Planomonospora sp. ID82291]